MSDFDPSGIRANLGLASRHVKDGASRGLDLAGQHLLREARNLVPIEEGTLERSGKVTRLGAYRRAVSFDGVYAVVQHERLDYRHDPGRTAKYLERPMNTERGVMLRIVGQAIRADMGS